MLASLKHSVGARKGVGVYAMVPIDTTFGEAGSGQLQKLLKGMIGRGRVHFISPLQYIYGRVTSLLEYIVLP